MAAEEVQRRSALTITTRLIGLVKPLAPFMVLAICFGVIGYLCAIFLTIIAGYALAGILAGTTPAARLGIEAITDPTPYFVALVVLGIARGVLHYVEQYCNHYIAFRLLALIRHKVFAQLRRLSPAKLEGRGKGNLIALITSDIELLEVFYAHTISPIAIALIVCIVMTGFIGSQSLVAGIIAVCAYLVVGVAIPMRIGRAGSQPGLRFRNAFGELNSFLLDSLRGAEETIQYGQGSERLQRLNARSRDLSEKQGELNVLEMSQRSLSNLAILGFSLLVLFACIWQYLEGAISFSSALVATIAMMGSFGPVLALSSLSNSLTQTLASGDRVLNLLEEDPAVEEVTDGQRVAFTGAALDTVTFSYGRRQAEDGAGNDALDPPETILQDFSLEVHAHKVTGIHGPSGCGKSTLLKLLMRFWDADTGTVRISGTDVRELDTAGLRDLESYVTQETWLFSGSIEDNIRIGSIHATHEQVVEAAKKASLHEFIMRLPNGYDTQIGELGDTLSGGERQRIGVARAFLHDAPLLLLDEPTSNLDSLNEGVILKSLREVADQKTVVLVSHRLSTLNFADRIVEMPRRRS